MTPFTDKPEASPPFGDDDLKRLKDALEKQKSSTDPFDKYGLHISYEGATSLLARLEAAEKVCEYLLNFLHPAQGTPTELKAWRKSKGE